MNMYSLFTNTWLVDINITTILETSDHLSNWLNYLGCPHKGKLHQKPYKLIWLSFWLLSVSQKPCYHFFECRFEHVSLLDTDDSCVSPMFDVNRANQFKPTTNATTSTTIWFTFHCFIIHATIDGDSICSIHGVFDEEYTVLYFANEGKPCKYFSILFEVTSSEKDIIIIHIVHAHSSRSVVVWLWSIYLSGLSIKVISQVWDDHEIAQMPWRVWVNWLH